MNNYPIKCEYCGRFISYDDLEKKRAVHKELTPDTAFTRETWESYHYTCEKSARLVSRCGKERLVKVN